MVIVKECYSDCIDIIRNVIEKSMGWFHAYYASACIDIGRCGGVIALDRDVVGVGVFYKVDLKPYAIGVIYYVAVDERYRGKGIGKMIVASIEELLNSDSLGYYVASTRSSNIGSRRMLQDLGYIEVYLDDLDSDLYEAILQAVCAYEDDILSIKPVKNSIEYLYKMLRDENNLKIVRDIWRVQCYGLWRKLRRT